MFKFGVAAALLLAFYRVDCQTTSSFWWPCSSSINAAVWLIAAWTYLVISFTYSGTPGPSSVSSPQCSGYVCNLSSGGYYNSTTTIFAQGAYQQLSVTATAASSLAPIIQLPAGQKDACNGLSPSCPTTVGTLYTWNLVNIPVPTSILFPANNVLITGKLLFCIFIYLRIW